jgi:hypothetical protein
MTSGFDQLARELGGAERRLESGARRPHRLQAGGPRTHPVRGLVLPLTTTAVVAAVVAVVVLTAAGTLHPAPHRHGSGPASSSGPSASSRQRGWRLPCDETVGTQGPERGMRVVLGVVALPGRPDESRALQTGRDGARLFAKSGLWVRPGARFELIVPTALRDRLSMTWGNAGEGNHGEVMIDRGCRAGSARWVNFVGGYWVRHPMCATLIVVSHGRRRRVRIGIGVGCPGQRPPAAPSQG